MLELTTGCRLHFGLMELAPRQPLRHAGLGLMLDQPGFRIRFQLDKGAEGFVDRAKSGSEPEYQERIAAVSERLDRLAADEAAHDITAAGSSETTASSGTNGDAYVNRCPVRIELLEQLPLHSGLGAGTQLATAIAAGVALVRSRLNRPEPPLGWTLAQLARLSGRGRRSSIGLQGFLSGGLVLDLGSSDGTEPGEARSFRCRSRHLPEAWRVVLLHPNCRRRVHGESESKLLAEVGSRPNPFREAMFDIAQKLQDDTSCQRDFTAFTGLLTDYMHMGARLFCDVQQGMYNGEAVADSVAVAADAGLRAVGQSSWGPSVFGFAADQEAAQRAAAAIQAARGDCRVRICRPARAGASWSSVATQPMVSESIRR